MGATTAAGANARKEGHGSYTRPRDRRSQARRLLGRHAAVPDVTDDLVAGAFLLIERQVLTVVQVLAVGRGGDPLALADHVVTEADALFRGQRVLRSPLHVGRKERLDGAGAGGRLRARRHDHGVLGVECRDAGGVTRVVRLFPGLVLLLDLGAEVLAGLRGKW